MIKKLLAALLICATLLSMAVACQKKPAAPESSTEASTEEMAEPRIIDIIANGEQNVRIIYNFTEIANNEPLALKLNFLITTLKNKTGVDLQVLNSEDTPYDPEALDFYIGSTGYPESIEAAKDLRKMDYSFSILGNKIVLVGGNDSSLTVAVTLFMTKVINPQFKKYDGKITFSEAQNVFYHAKYSASSIMVGNKDLKDFTIVIPKNCLMAEQEIAYMLKDIITSKYGHELPVADDTNTYENEILIGNTARTTITTSSRTEYAVEVTDKNVQILAGATPTYDYIIELFNLQFFPQCKIESVKADAKEDYQRKKDSILETTGDVRIIFHNVYGGTNPSENIYTNPVLRWKLDISLYTDYQADILCFQEFNSLPRKNSTGLVPLLLQAGYVEVPATSGKVITQFKNNDKNAGIITGWTLDTSGATKANTPIFYNPQKLKLVKYGSVVYRSELPDSLVAGISNEKERSREKFNDNPRYNGVSKMAVWAIFQDKTTGKLFAIASTHLDHQDTMYANERRKLQSQELLNVINNEILVGEYADLPMIFGGDINTSYTRENSKYGNSGAMTNFEAAGFKNVQQTLAGADQRSSYGGYANFDENKGYFATLGTSTGTATDSIDHCVYKGNAEPTFFDIMDHKFARKTSDHLPVVVDFKIK